MKTLGGYNVIDFKKLDKYILTDNSIMLYTGIIEYDPVLDRKNISYNWNASGKCANHTRIDCYIHPADIKKYKTDTYLYYIQNTEVYHGNAVIWWSKNSAGYTSDINNAGKYTKKEAQRICKNRKTERA